MNYKPTYAKVNNYFVGTNPNVAFMQMVYNLAYE